MIYGLDAAYPPSLAQARSQYRLGWRFHAGYIGGPRATNAWSNADFGRLASVGFSFLPIYVAATYPWDDTSGLDWQMGFDAGVEADGKMGECGFNETQICVLDAEYGD